MYRLLSATPSPYARKVRIALAEKAIPFELMTEVPWNAGAQTPKHNPLGKVPVLILENGDTVYESSFVLEWLEVRHPEPPLFPADPDERLAARRLEVLCDGVCDAIVLSVLEGLRDHPSESWLERQAAKIRNGLAEMARLVPDDADYAVGQSFGLGDIAVGTMLGYLDGRYQGLDWRSPYPALARRFERLHQRPSFDQTRPIPQTLDPGVV